MITISVRLQVTTLQYYLHEANPANGLIRDRIHSATGQLLQLFGVTIPMYRDLGSGALNVTKIVWRQFD